VGIIPALLPRTVLLLHRTEHIFLNEITEMLLGTVSTTFILT
jgi:hypothetical protein